MAILKDYDGSAYFELKLIRRVEVDNGDPSCYDHWFEVDFSMLTPTVQFKLSKTERILQMEVQSLLNYLHSFETKEFIPLYEFYPEAQIFDLKFTTLDGLDEGIVEFECWRPVGVYTSGAVTGYFEGIRYCVDNAAMLLFYQQLLQEAAACKTER